MHTLNVALGDRGYPILIGAGLLGADNGLPRMATGREVALISNRTVAPLYGERVKRLLIGAARIIDVVLDDGEQFKDWSTLSRIFDALIAARFDRNCLLIALGGGVIGDMTGFAAATYQRGVEFVQIPTTLLAMVDSAVGGKTAINHPQAKNMIGAFHQPKLVLADLDVLKTLPVRELSAGLAEIIKHGVVADALYLDQIEAGLDRMLAIDAATLAPIIARSCEIKADVVARDEREQGVRAILNFGHTFGHAIEAGLGYGHLLHGEAVGVGMVLASDLSERLGMIDASLAQRIRRIVAAAKLPTRAPNWSFERWIELMSIDKKAQAGTPRFVLLKAIAEPIVRKVDDQSLRACLAACAATGD